MSIYKLRITNDLGFEVWQDITGYEGLYQVSTYGRVRSVNFNHTGEIKVMLDVNNRGYRQISLSKNNIKFTRRVHTLVADAFLPKISKEYTEINHKDENKTNNRVENLEWCTHEYNNAYGTRNQRIGDTLGKSVVQFSMKGGYIKTYNSAKEAQRLLGHSWSNHITEVCNGKRKSAYGYIWKYA